MKKLNLGCGATFHRDWVNVDVISRAPGVIAHDLRKGVPFEDSSFDAVYHSHILEHFPREDGEAFLRECLRVLKPGGVLRVVVPDLERIARAYLEKLDAAARGEPGAEHDYDWMMIELMDQTVRSEPGGDMARWFERPQGVPNVEFVRSRIGAEVDGLLAPPERSRGEMLAAGWRSRGEALRRARSAIAGVAVAAIGGPAAAGDFREGVFRNSGSIHKWMYDRYSLARVLRKLGARDVEVKDAFQSRIPGFGGFSLDADGTKVRKPDSLFVEALR